MQNTTLNVSPIVYSDYSNTAINWKLLESVKNSFFGFCLGLVFRLFLKQILKAKFIVELEGYWAGMSAEQKVTMDYRQLAFISGYFFDETTSRWEESTRWDLLNVDMNDCKGCLQSAGPHTKKVRFCWWLWYLGFFGPFLGFDFGLSSKSHFPNCQCSSCLAHGKQISLPLTARP